MRKSQIYPIWWMTILLSIFTIISFILIDQRINLWMIITAKSVLITDYIQLAGLTSAFLNVSLVMVFLIIMSIRLKIEINGIMIAAFFTTMGFAFFGKNIYNILPIFLGVYLYSRYQQQSFKHYFHIAMFATALGPLVTLISEAGLIGIIVGHFLAIGYGFIVAPLSKHISTFHQGFTVYNIGFTGGLVAIITAAVLKQFGFKLETVSIISTSTTNHNFMLVFLIIMMLTLLIISLKHGRISLKDYFIMTQSSGQNTDFYQQYGPALTYFNMAVVGAVVTTATLCTGLPLNGATFGSIIAVIGFAAYGKHLKNILPVMTGVFIMMNVSSLSITTGSVLALIFATGLAPIAGHYGIIGGITAGMMHYSLVAQTAAWQGGVNLYNNGFSSGFIALFIHQCQQIFIKKRLQK